MRATSDGAHLPSRLQRRFEAVVFVGAAVRDSETTVGDLAELRRAGMHIGIVGGPAFTETTERVQAPAGFGALLICDERGINLLAVDDVGLVREHHRSAVPPRREAPDASSLSPPLKTDSSSGVEALRGR